MNRSRISDVDADEAENFEPWDPKYRCCCGSVHVKQGALIIAITAVVLIVYSIFITFLNLGLHSGWNKVQVLWLLADLVIVSLFIYGIIVVNHKFLIPYFVYSLHIILLLLFIISISIYCLIWPSNAEQWFPFEVLFEERNLEQLYYNPESAVKTVSVFLLISSVFSLIILIWTIWVSWKCYRFLNKIENLRFFLDERERKRYLPLQLDR